MVLRALVAFLHFHFSRDGTSSSASNQKNWGEGQKISFGGNHYRLDRNSVSGVVAYLPLHSRLFFSVRNQRDF